MGCPDEIDYTYVKSPPERSMGMQWGDVRITTCSMGYHGEETRDCSKCDYYRVCDAKQRVDIEGKEWTPPMRSRSEMEAMIKELEPMAMQNDVWIPEFAAIRGAKILALEWVLGKRKEL